MSTDYEGVLTAGEQLEDAEDERLRASAKADMLSARAAANATASGGERSTDAATLLAPGGKPL